jgi:hypothetical protein
MTKKYYLFEFGDLEKYDEANVKEPFCVNYGGKDRIFTNNKKTVNGNPVFEFRVHSKIPIFDLVSNLERYQLMSPELIKTILFLDNSVQVFDAKSFDENETSNLQDFKVINFIKTISCFDWEKSIYDDEYKEYDLASHADKVVLDSDKVPNDAHIFLVQEMTRGIVFTEFAKLKIEEKNFTGIKFIDLESFTY